MNIFQIHRFIELLRRPYPVAVGVVCLVIGSSAGSTPAQTVQPQPTAATTPLASPTIAPSPTPVATASPVPTAAPYPSPASTPGATPDYSPTPFPTTNPGTGGSPVLTIVPGLPSAADMDAYDTARTPQINITLTAATLPSSGVSNTNTASPRASTSQRPVVKGGACPAITLQPAPAARSKTSAASASDTAANAQPVATVTLAYNNGAAGERVWVQMLRGGVLTATDGSGKVYDGNHGFFLTLDAGGAATFSYQAPNTGGTYQVLTRYTNVKTTLTFFVPDPAP